MEGDFHDQETNGYSTYHTELRYEYGPIYATDAQGRSSTSYGFDWRNVQVETRHAPDPAKAARLKPQWEAADREATRLEELAGKLKGLDKAADDALLVAKKSATEQDAALKRAVKSVIAKRILNGSIGIAGLSAVGYSVYSAVSSGHEQKELPLRASEPVSGDWSQDAR